MNSWTHTPVNCVWFACFTSLLLGLLAFAGPAAIGAIFSLVPTSQFIAYSIPITCRFFGGAEWVPGPFKLGRMVRLLVRSYASPFSRNFAESPCRYHRAPLDGILHRHLDVPNHADGRQRGHELHCARAWRVAPPLRCVLLLPEVRRRLLVQGTRADHQ